MMHLYDDDTQLYLTFYPNEGAGAVKQMADSINEIRDWMEAHLNDAKTKFVVLASRHIETKLGEDRC